MYVPEIVELQDRVAVPEPVTVLGVMGLQVSPDGNGVSDSVTVPANPFSAVIVMIEVGD